MRTERVRNVAVVLGLGLFLSVVVVTEILGMRRVPAPLVTRAPAAWAASITAVDGALAEGDVGRALLLWHPAYVDVLYNRRWEGLIEVGEARLRIERAAGFPEIGESRARELYRMALFRAKQQGSLAGVRRAAAAFDALGDREVAAQAIRMAATLEKNPQLDTVERGRVAHR